MGMDVLDICTAEGKAEHALKLTYAAELAREGETEILHV